MSKKKLYKDRDYIQIVIDKKDKAAFDAWCAVNRTTMSEVIRHEIAHYIMQGEKILEAQSELAS